MIFLNHYFFSSFINLRVSFKNIITMMINDGPTLYLKYFQNCMTTMYLLYESIFFP